MVIEIDPTSLLVGRCQAFICEMVPVVVLTNKADNSIGQEGIKALGFIILYIGGGCHRQGKAVVF